MALKNAHFQALVEREGVIDFLWARTWKDIEGSKVSLFELATDRWGCIFQIFPGIYSADAVENSLSSFLSTIDLPEKSTVQFLSYASRNLSGYVDSYLHAHSEPTEKLEHTELLHEVRENRKNWLNAHANKNIYPKGGDLRLRNFVNLVCVTIPTKKDGNTAFTESEVVSHFSKIEQGLGDFAPKKFTRQNYVSLMREILVPDAQQWLPPDDSMNAINYQCADNNSVLVVDEDNVTLGLGTMINKTEYDKLQIASNKAYLDETKEDKGFFASLFGKKTKKQDVERVAYTKWHAKVFTTKLFPSLVSLFGTNEKFTDFFGERMSPKVPCPFMLSLVIYLEGTEKTRRDLAENARWNVWQTSSLGSAAKYFPRIVERYKESEDILHLLNDGAVPMLASWSCILFDDDLMRLSEYGESLKNEFLSTQWSIQEEALIPHWVFFNHLPLNIEPYVLKNLAKRMNTMFSPNAASITPLVTGDKGFGEPVLTYLDRNGQLAGVDIFSSETNYNFVVVGSSGSGKSYSMADFFTNYLMRGAKIRVFDVGHSYRDLCHLVGGQYIEFTQDAELCLNFFTNIQTDSKGEIAEDEMQSLIPLVALMAMQSVDPEDTSDLGPSVISSYISRAIKIAFEKKQKNAGMQEVVEALESIAYEQKQNNFSEDTDQKLKDLTNGLYSYGNEKGEYFKYFNGENNIKFESDFVVLELQEIDAKKQLKSVALAAISHMVYVEFFLGSKEQKKILAVDEAWSIVSDKNIMRFLETVARRIRKHNGACGIITQQVSDFSKNDATRTLFSQAAWKFLLFQTSDASVSGSDELLDPTVKHFLRTIKVRPPHFSELLIKKEGGSFMVGRLFTDRVAHWLYTNHHDDKKTINQIMDDYNVTNIDARLIKGYSLEKSTSVEEEYLSRQEAGLLRTKKEVKSGYEQ